ncbi:MAG: GNAT family N-acetyltransferase [Candidatus Eisenbacteria bacterium]|nr:GNAT family N-acetyltransferase [Candidatus Eisenbacteria bacterium]
MIPRTIRTKRLLLEPAGPEKVEAEMRGGEAFGGALRAAVPPGWPPEELRDALPVFAEGLRLRPDAIGWYGWHWILPGGEGRALVGSGGFHGPPDREGSVEIGYGVAPVWRRRGFAAEGTAALLAWAFAHPEVRRVVAETESGNGPSIRVLEKNGFRPDGKGKEPETLRFTISREQFRSPPPRPDEGTEGRCE